MISKHKLGQKKVALFPEIGRVKKFLPPTHLHNKSKMCMRIYIFSLKKHTQLKKIPLASLFVWICFFPFKQGQIGLPVQQQRK